jgi:hypothetical protein
VRQIEFLFFKQRLRELLRVEGLQIGWLLARASTKRSA